MLGLLRELLQLFLPRLVRLAAAGTHREEKYTPSANRILGVRPRYWGFLLVFGGLVVSLLEAATGGAPARAEARSVPAGRLKCAHLVGWGAALFADPRAVALVYLLRLPMAYVDYACRRGLRPPTADVVAQELFVTLLALSELWWRYRRFERAALPGFVRGIEREGQSGAEGGGKARTLRKYTVMFRVSEHTVSSDVEKLLQQAEGHFPLPRRWDKRCVEGSEWVFLEYEDVGTHHSGTEQLVCKVPRHPSRGKMFAGVGLATLREVEEICRVDIPTDRIKLEPEHVVFTLFGRSLADCQLAEKQLHAIAPSDARTQVQIRSGNAFARGKRAEEVLRRSGLHVAVRQGGNHGGIAECIGAYREAMASGESWAVQAPALPRPETSEESRALLRQKDGYDSVSVYRQLGGPISRMLLNGTGVEVRGSHEFEGTEWLEVRLQGGGGSSPADGGGCGEEAFFVKRHNVVGSPI